MIIVIFAVIFWLVLFYYLVLTAAGLAMRGNYRPAQELREWPGVTVLIPCHNEAKVIDATLAALVAQDYPKDKLNIWVLDDRSTDGTGDIARKVAAIYPFVKVFEVPPGENQGKARVLNYGLSMVSTPYLSIYDADNRPEPQAIRRLMSRALSEPGLAGAVGYVKTLNLRRNILTRMIGLEFMVFQLIMQCGRWQLFKLGSLTGTNYVLSTAAVRECGGWNELALAEDLDLTIELTARKMRVAVVPDARTWEQEPERISTWVRQRTRWIRGNLFTAGRILRTRRYKTSAAIFGEMVQLISIYVLFTIVLIASDIYFVGGLFGVFHNPITGLPFIILWYMMAGLYWFQITTSAAIEDEADAQNMGTALLMYFTYSQAWLIPVLRAVAQWVTARRVRGGLVWEKTIRF
jgi:cellulose synthase/poly-beta-1,6-N-acetylglucosamine synthase-like glycosyltransferase